MTTTANIGFTLLEEGQEDLRTPLNDLMARTDRWLARGVKSRTTTAQPGSPAEGDGYIIPYGATGAQWGGFNVNYVAIYLDAAWNAYAPVGRVRLYVDDEAKDLFWNGSAWVDPYTAGGFLTSGEIDTLAKLNAIVTDATLASQAYVTGVLAGLVDLKGNYDADTNTPDLDTAPSGILKGDAYECSVAGTFFSFALEVGDLIVAKQDDPTTEAHWIINKKAGDSGSSGPLNKFDATTAPTVDNDVDEGYAVGSRWIDVTNDKEYVCLDATDGAAVWTETTVGPSGASTGTFTPTIQDASLSDGEGQTYSAQSGRYTKIGNTVFFWIDLTITSIGSLTAGQQVYIAGLPFLPDATAGVGVQYASGLNVTADESLSGIIGFDTGQDIVRVYKWGIASGTEWLLMSNLSPTSRFILSGQYTTSS